MNTREDLLREMLDPHRVKSVKELCSEYGVSKKTAYKWKKRLLEGGVAGLKDRSRRPKRCPLKTTADMVADVVSLRRSNPRFGPKKLRALLLREHDEAAVPSVKTIDRILRRCGEPRMMRRIRKQPLRRTPPRVEVTGPNDLWTIDFKGWWKTEDGTRVHPLTVRDAHSRYVLAVEVLTNQRALEVRAVLRELFRRYGLPKAMLSDNGAPFGSTSARGGLTRLSAWLVSLGIQVVFSRPANPQDNGGHERMHLDLKIDVEDRCSATLREEQAAAARWLHKFNHHRPHEALDQRLPSEVYRPSVRRLTGPKRIPVYPAGWTSRTVGSPGRISVDGSLYYIGAGLTGHVVGLEPLEGSRVRVWFFEHDLGELDLSIVTMRRRHPVDIEWAPQMEAAK